MQWKGYTK